MQNYPDEPARPSSRKPETKVISLRLTEKERQHLLERAGSVPLGAYVRSLILAPDARQGRRRIRNPLKDEAALARVLAALGQSRLSSNLNQLAKAAHIGILPPETEQDIANACLAVQSMRTDLIEALGLEDRR